MTQPPSTSSLRRLYLEWVEEQLEDFKDSVPRSELLQIADEVCADLEMNRSGQYQLTEILLLEEVDRTLIRRLKLPGFNAWAAAYRKNPPGDAPPAAAPPEPDPDAPAPPRSFAERPPVSREEQVASI